jgi:hypothetical protein
MTLSITPTEEVTEDDEAVVESCIGATPASLCSTTAEDLSEALEVT